MIPDKQLRSIYFDDLEAGAKFESTEYEITKMEVLEFARRYDPQPFHLDEEAAQATVFGSLVSSGWLTASLSMRLIVDSVPLAGGIAGIGGDLSWPKPTRPGDRIKVVTEVMSLKLSRTRLDIGNVVVRCETVNQLCETVQVFSPTLLVMRRLRSQKMND